MRYALYALAALNALNALLAVGRIGQARVPLTPGDVVAIIVMNAGIATVLVLAAGQVPA